MCVCCLLCSRASRTQQLGIEPGSFTSMATIYSTSRMGKHQRIGNIGVCSGRPASQTSQPTNGDKVGNRGLKNRETPKAHAKQGCVRSDRNVYNHVLTEIPANSPATSANMDSQSKIMGWKSGRRQNTSKTSVSSERANILKTNICNLKIVFTITRLGLLSPT